MNTCSWILMLVFCVAGSADATVINFDDILLNTGMYQQIPGNYAGLTWGSSAEQSSSGTAGYFSVWNNTGYATPHSSSNYVFNTFGVNDLWFSFSNPVDFGGAWFSIAHPGGNRAESVRFKDDLGQVSAWLAITGVPQYLPANFSGSTTIYIERIGSNPLEPSGSLWYTMDDIVYTVRTAVPEPSMLFLFGSGLVGLLAGRRILKR